MAQFVNMFEIDLQKPTRPQPLRAIVGEGDANGIKIGAYVTDGGSPVSLGGSCVGKVVRADGATVQLTGTISGNSAYVVLDQQSCAIEGQIQVAVCWVNSSNVTTLVIAYGTVVNTQTGTAIQPSTPIPDLTQLLAQISAMETATAAANAAASSALTNFAGAFSSSTAYTAGQYVTYTDGKFYRFTTNHAAGAWNSAHVVAVTAGGELADLKSAINNVDSAFEHGLVSNLVNPGLTVAGELVNQTNGIFTAAATHTRTPLIEVKPSTTYSIALYNDSVEYIRYALYNTSKAYITGGFASVADDLHYLLTTTSETAYIAISSPTTQFPIMLIESSVRVKYRAYGVVVDTVKDSFMPTITPDMTDFFIMPDNLVDPDAVVVGEYVNQLNGNFASNAAHSRTTYIPVTPGGKYCGAFQSNIDTIPIRYAWYNSSKSYREGDMQTLATLGSVLTAPSNASYLVISAFTVYFPLMIQASETKIDYIPYGRTDPVLPSKYIDDASLRNTYYKQYRGNAQSYTLGVTNSIKKNKVINLGFDFASFGTLNITLTDAGGGVQNKFAIDGTNVTRTVNGTQQTPVAHGLTITNHINVTIEVDIEDIKLTIVSNGSAYNATYTYNSGRIVATYSVASMTVSNVDFSWTCKDFKKGLWCYGDSYFSYGDNRWIYYLYADGYADNVLLDAYAGENSEASMDSLISYITVAQPKMIVWCVGMNDGSDSGGTPSGMWKTAIDNLLSICNTFNIIPVLATVPTVPTINHEAKNAWVRASGYQYIDFAKAVGADSSGNWFTGMLSQDGVHPTVAGAMALYRQAITDCPQLMID